MGACRVVVLMNKMIYEVLGTVPGITQVPPHMPWGFGPKGPEPGSMSPLPTEAGELGIGGGSDGVGLGEMIQGRLETSLVCSKCLISATYCLFLLPPPPLLPY